MKFKLLFMLDRYAGAGVILASRSVVAVRELFHRPLDAPPNEEKVLHWQYIDAMAGEAGLLLHHAADISPPCSRPFLRYFAVWPPFLAATEALCRFHQTLKRAPPWWRVGSIRPIGLGSGSCLLGLWQKPTASCAP